MRRTVTLGILLSSALASAGTLSTPILGGTKTTLGQYPSVVAIEVGGGLCSGTLITPDWVLTAAHCVQNMSVSSIKVHFNTVNVFSSPGKVVTASMAIAKPTFSQNALGKNDIGLIKLSTPVTDITPIPVNLDAAKAPVGVTVTMVGYGLASTTNQNAVGTEYVVEQTSIACNSFAGSDADLLCFSQVSGKGKCEGDSGGPSFATINGKLVQVGITSFGDQNCTQFGADTRTDAEKAFLLQYIPNLGSCETDADCDKDHICFAKKCIVTPYATGGVGADCKQNTDCESGTCANDGDKAYCTMSCTVGDNSTCPADLECQAAGGAGVCWPKADTGCCDASGRGAPTALLGMAFLGLVLGRKRRRR